MISNHQFDFRGKHATIEQIHRIIKRIIKRINNDMETNRYCTVVLLDISQAFNKVWHQDYFKIKNFQLISMPLRPYLLHRTFKVKYREVVTQLKEINSEPQGRVLGPVLYILLIFWSLWAPQ